MAKRTKRRSPAPDADYVLGLYRWKLQDNDEARLRTLSDTFRSLTRLAHKVDIPTEYQAITKPIRTPYLRDAWLRTTAALLQKPPTVHVEPANVHDKYRRAANIVERWDLAMIERLNREVGDDAIFESAKSLVRDGESVIKVVHKPDAWANFPRREDHLEDSADKIDDRQTTFKRKSVMPIARRCVDRLSVLFGDGEYGDDWVIEYGEYPTPYLSREYEMNPVDGRLVNPKNILGGKPKPEGYYLSGQGQSVKLEYMDADWWHVVIDGSDAPDFPQPNPYSPKLNYIRAKAPDSESLLYSLLFLVPALDRLMTMKMNWAHLGGYPNPMIRPVSGAVYGDVGVGDDKKTAKFKWKPGKLLELPAGYEFLFAMPPPVGKDLDDLIKILMNLVEVAGVPAIMRGDTSGDPSGYLANQLLAATMIALRAAADALQRQTASYLEFIHFLVSDVIKQDVPVQSYGKSQRWLAVKPTGEPTETSAPVDMIGPIEVRFRPTLPTQEQAAAMIANQLTQSKKPLISRKRAIEKYLMEEDPEGVLDEIWAEDALDAEPLATQVREEAARRAGLLPPVPPPVPPMSGLVGPGGQPLPSTLSPGMAGLPGQAQLGMPTVPGINMPMAPQGPRPPGMFPGQPNTPQAGGIS